MKKNQQDFTIQGNTVSPEKFNPPSKCEVYVDGKLAGTCRVYDSASWRNKNKGMPARADEAK